MLSMMSYQYHGVFADMNRENAAYTIQSIWREKRYNPRNGLCYRIEMTKINELYIEYGIGCREELEELTPDFMSTIMKYKRLEFQEELEKTKVFLHDYTQMKKKVVLKAKRRKKYNIIV